MVYYLPVPVIVHVHINYMHYRTAALSSLSVDSLGSELKDSLEWGDGALAVVKHVWKEEGPALCGMPKETLNIGQVSVYCMTVYFLGTLFLSFSNTAHCQ